jgi:hypothetical protein
MVKCYSATVFNRKMFDSPPAAQPPLPGTKRTRSQSSALPDEPSQEPKVTQPFDKPLATNAKRHSQW